MLRHSLAAEGIVVTPVYSRTSLLVNFSADKLRGYKDTRRIGHLKYDWKNGEEMKADIDKNRSLTIRCAISAVNPRRCAFIGKSTRVQKAG
jgi:hypothetical protein